MVLISGTSKWQKPVNTSTWLPPPLIPLGEERERKKEKNIVSFVHDALEKSENKQKKKKKRRRLTNETYPSRFGIENSAFQSIFMSTFMSLSL